MKVLVLHPAFDDPGGVANLYRSFDRHLRTPVDHLFVGRRTGEQGGRAALRRLASDYRGLLSRLGGERYDIVLLNPSLDFKGSVRDGIALTLARRRTGRTIVFFHGWLWDFAARLRGPWLTLFRLAYRRADAFIILGRDFGRALEGWGLTQRSFLLPTAVDNELLRGFDFDAALRRRKESEEFTVLFLARLVRDKGPYETIDACALAGEQSGRVRLIVAGDGEEMDGARHHVEERGLGNVEFAGYVEGEAKRDLFARSHVFCLPTRYREGLPVSLLEAASFGLPVITRPAGGIGDFFTDGVHGYVRERRDAQSIAREIDSLWGDENLYERMARQNYRLGQESFLASRVAGRLDDIFREVLDG